MEPLQAANISEIVECRYLRHIAVGTALPGKQGIAFWDHSEAPATKKGNFMECMLLPSYGTYLSSSLSQNEMNQSTSDVNNLNFISEIKVWNSR